MLDLVDTEGKREPGKVDLRMGGFDLIWDGGPVVRFDRPTSMPSMLGCFNERDNNQHREERDTRGQRSTSKNVRNVELEAEIEKTMKKLNM